jgi:hypothetical protein
MAIQKDLIKSFLDDQSLLEKQDRGASVTRSVKTQDQLKKSW